ncbi:MAG: heme A synthase [Candidatus Eremiobacteraeota bacterium]|nr:heme A synthase [Candidatus Eremiobacteraeota bacterium]
MSSPPITSSVSVATLRYTSLAAAIFAFALVVWGGIVRINGAGMTCPDWPRCRGAWFPALNDPVVYEWTHRLGAPLLTLLIIATIVAAWRARRERPAAWRASWIAGALLVAQVIVGALTIKYANNPPSVAAHLGLGILTFVSLLMVWYAASQAQDAGATAAEAVPTSTAAMKSRLLWLSYARLSVSAAIATFAAIVAAGYMSASNDGLACTGFPLCNGWGPPVDASQQIHMGHRVLAYLAFVLILGVALGGARTADPRVRRLAWLALALSVLQVGLGVGTIASGLAPVLRSVHQANGALLFATLATLCYAAYVRFGRTASATTAASERARATAPAAQHP